MLSCPSITRAYNKVGAVKAWRSLAGPTNPEDAKSSDPSSLRALFGTDGTKNAVHGSDSFASALREVNFCFKSDTNAAEGVPVGGKQTGNGFEREERTLALLKPGVSELHAGEGSERVWPTHGLAGQSDEWSGSRRARPEPIAHTCCGEKSTVFCDDT